MSAASAASGETAIARKKPSQPLAWLLDHGLVKGRVLDFGCGRGDDVKQLRRRRISADGWDPYWESDEPRGKYDVVLCTYVVNVLPRSRQAAILRELRSWCKPNGAIYVAVRADVEHDGPTSRGYQRDVRLRAPELVDNGSMRIYAVPR